MPPPRKYPDEIRERAVRLVFEQREATGVKVGAIARVADQHQPRVAAQLVRRAEIDGGARPGTSTDDRQRIAELEREMRRANEILKSAAAFLGAELDRQPRR